ncbi:MAG: YggS family pyridoxal phosphate-dependent enzyme [Firmicutes bacterium]|nr:YggS family pyridoxal phosphate-dependent enzyme [Bacillota bacterium]
MIDFFSMNTIADNLKQIRKNIAAACASARRESDSVKILAATKTVEPERIGLLSANGVTLAGENRVQEFLAKYSTMYGASAQELSTICAATNNCDIEWHFIGALQTNKVRQIIDKVTLIHSLDRFSLADEIERQSHPRGVITEVLIEINAGGEDSKSGVSLAKLEDLYQYTLQEPHVRVVGFMPVLPAGAPEYLYAKMEGIFRSYQSRDPNIRELSMGMSGDYELAIRYGATIVRLGSCLFGERGGIIR